eukprot:TRINITY_DN9753_c0_g1_i1.p1 TRINITY_DN9753_c0_g1~~TRINITY_DN9753_c0_g1_i1.p1  ORF type:complete len:122 (+),score=28.37 TRINITY_DN9753_c0_g1_i1:191-556(+)
MARAKKTRSTQDHTSDTKTTTTNLDHFTGRSVRDEHVCPTVDIIAFAKTRRLKWVGHVLRSEESNLVRQVLCAEVIGGEQYQAGGVLSELPPHSNLEDLLEMVSEKDVWRRFTKFKLSFQS